MKLRVHGAHATFMCPGCEEEHTVKIDGGFGSWAWDGSVYAPTLHPSVKLTSGHFIEGHEGGCWCTYDWQGEPPEFSCKRCHSFIEVGNIRFLEDCSHGLAGKTVPLPDIEVAA